MGGRGVHDQSRDRHSTIHGCRRNFAAKFFLSKISNKFKYLRWVSRAFAPCRQTCIFPVFGLAFAPDLSAFLTGLCNRFGIRKTSSPDVVRPSGNSVFAARGEPFRAEKNSPVIAPNLQPNRGFLENITGNNRHLLSAVCNVTRVQWKVFPAPSHAKVRAQSSAAGGACAQILSTRPRTRARRPSSGVCRVLPSAISFARETRNMAMEFVARNRTNLQLCKIVGTKLESLPRIFGECFCTSSG
jgi:hypothetical protein